MIASRSGVSSGLIHPITTKRTSEIATGTEIWFSSATPPEIASSTG